ncbi:hypothetical protein J6590_054263 [Homalodisca vitripennis]|nr:hypothetical protein J6590_027504 [Homalodisca vitripennis]KAG8310940.1 hypothetical protein J6590_054263 [Homalodisca vitripennis]
MDETPFLCPKGEKVLGMRGQKNMYEINSGSDKRNLTVLSNASASGEPLDVAVFRLEKQGWATVTHEWRMSKDGEHLNKFNFAPLLKKAKYSLVSGDPSAVVSSEHRSELIEMGSGSNDPDEVQPISAQEQQHSSVIVKPACSSNCVEMRTVTSQEKLAKVLSPGTNGKNVPSPFKKNLFRPGTPEKSKKKQLRKQAVKLPAVVSSGPWLKYELKRKEEKIKIDKEKAEKKKAKE